MESDPILQNMDLCERQVAKEFLMNWLPFLTKGLCEGCEVALLDRIQSLNPETARNPGESQEEEVDRGVKNSDLGYSDEVSDVAGGFDGYFGASREGWEHIKATGWDTDPEPKSPKVRMSWDDMVQQDQLEEEQEEEARKNFWENGMQGEKEEARLKKNELFREQSQQMSFTSLGRKNDFVCLERIDGRIVNILDGLELRIGVFSAVEQRKTLDFVYELQEKGRTVELGGIIEARGGSLISSV